jgi:hypothetical protein
MRLLEETMDRELMNQSTHGACRCSRQYGGLTHDISWPDGSGAAILIAGMPVVTLRTVVNDREEAVSEYICDWPDCPNIATVVVGVVRELRMRSALCAEHAARLTSKHHDDRRR